MSVTLSDLKGHLKLSLLGGAEATAEDTELQAYLDAALDFVSVETGHILERAARVSYFDEFGDLELDGDNVTAITVTYIDGDGATQTLSTDVYELKSHKAKPYLTLKYGQSWPSVRGDDAGISVAYTSGFTSGTIPPRLKSGVLLMAASLYEMREEFAIGVSISQSPNTVERLIGGYRLHRL